MSHTETDLREAFASLALDLGAEPDVADLRARLTAMLAAETAEADDNETEVLDLQPVRSRRMLPRRAGLLVAAVAAVAAAVAGLVVVLLPEPKVAIDPADKLREIAGKQFPGTVAVAYYQGEVSESSRSSVHFPLATDGNSTQPAAATLATPYVNLAPGAICAANYERTGSFSGAGDAVGARLHIRVPSNVSWQLVLSQAPEVKSNATIAKPADNFSLVSPPGDVLQQEGEVSGTASRVITLSRALAAQARSASQRYTVRLTCAGSDDHPGCADGWRAATPLHPHVLRRLQYEWRNVSLAAVTSLRVEAAAGTAWRLRIASY